MYLSHIIEIRRSKLKFTWDPRRIDSSLTGRANDKVNIVCFNEDFSSDIKTFSSKRRTDGEAVIFLPHNWTADETHIWIYLTSWDFMENSESVYMRICKEKEIIKPT